MARTVTGSLGSAEGTSTRPASAIAAASPRAGSAASDPALASGTNPGGPDCAAANRGASSITAQAAGIRIHQGRAGPARTTARTAVRGRRSDTTKWS